MSRSLYFEDFKPGDRFETRSLTLTESLVLEFARFYDPQPFHTDPEAAKQSIYGGLIASGGQTIAISFKLFFETGLLVACSLGSPGLDEVRWKAPVRPGDTLRVECEVLQTRLSRSRPGQGIVKIRVTTFNQHGDTVQTFEPTLFVGRRPV